MWVAALGCSPDRCWRIRTHTRRHSHTHTHTHAHTHAHRFSAPSQALQHGRSRPQYSHQASHHICVSITTFPQRQTKVCPAICFYKHSQETKTPWLLGIPLSSLVSCISSYMTHNLNSEPDRDRDRARCAACLRKIFFSIILWPPCFLTEQMLSLC